MGMVGAPGERFEVGGRTSLKTEVMVSVRLFTAMIQLELSFNFGALFLS